MDQAVLTAPNNPLAERQPDSTQAPQKQLSDKSAQLTSDYFNSHSFLVCSFCLLNLLSFHALLFIPYFAEISLELRTVFLPIYLVLTLMSLSALLIPISSNVWNEMKQFRISSQLLIYLGTILSVAAFLMQFFNGVDPLLLNPWHDLIIICWLASTYLESRKLILNKLNQDLILSTIDNNQNLRLIGITAESGQTWVNIQNARIGDRFRVESGEIIACDGVVERGFAQVYEMRAPGPAILRFRSVGDEVWAGSRLKQGSLDIKLTATIEDSRIKGFEDIFYNGLAGAEHSERSFKRLARSTAIIMLVLAFVCAELLFFVHAPLARVFSGAACMLFFTLIVDLFVLLGLTLQRVAVSAFRAGILSKDASIFEQIKNLRSVAFDVGHDGIASELDIVNFEIIDTRVERNGILAALVAICSKLESKWAETLLAYAVKEMTNDFNPLSIPEIRYYGDRGASALVEGTDITIGIEEVLIERGVQLDTGLVNLHPANKASISNVLIYFIALEDEVIARVSFKSGNNCLSETVEALRRSGFKPQLLSNCDTKILDKVGADLGIDKAHIHGNLTAENMIHKLEDIRPVALVACDTTKLEVIERADISLSVYDELLCDSQRTDLTLFGLNTLLVPFKLYERVKWSYRLVGIVAGLGTTALVLAGVMFGPLAGVAITTSVIGLFLNALLIKLLLPIAKY